MPTVNNNATAKTPKGVKLTKVEASSKISTGRIKAPTSGRKKGFKKQSIDIKDPYLEPYYIICEDRQYIKMQTGSTMPQGYYTSLVNVVSSIVKDLLLVNKAGSTLSLSQFIKEYEQVQSKVLSKINI